MVTLVTRKRHSQMNIVVVVLDVRLLRRRIIAIRAEVQNLVVNLCHVAPRVARVRELFGAGTAPVQSILALFGKGFYFHTCFLMPVLLPHVIPQIIFLLTDKVTQVTWKLEVYFCLQCVEIVWFLFTTKEFLS